MITQKEKRLMNELIVKREKQDYLCGKFEERNIIKFTVRMGHVDRHVFSCIIMSS